MRSLTGLAVLLLAFLDLAPGVAARPRACRANGAKPLQVGKAIYFITNDQQNAVAAVPIGADGMLSNGVLVATGGAGSNAIDGATQQPAVPDALVSQSALTIAGNHLFAVNAGSNTLSMFSISSADPTKLTLVGRPVAISGEFPNTVAASSRNKLVCVGATGAKAGVSCSSFSERGGLGAMDELRPFDLGQTTPPVGPTNTVSQVFFSADEGSLFVTVKGDPAANKTGFFSVFAVEEDCGAGQGQGQGRGRERGRGSAGVASLARNDTRSSPGGTAVLFGSTVIPGSNNSVFVTDAAFGAAVLTINENDDTATLAARQPIDGQKATCWATVSPATGTAFVTDVAVNRVVEMRTDDAAIVGQVDLSANGDPGLIDLRAAGGFVYALSPGNGAAEAAITVLDVSGGPGTAKQVQHFKLGSLGAGKNSMGMAVLA